MPLAAFWLPAAAAVAVLVLAAALGRFALWMVEKDIPPGNDDE